MINKEKRKALKVSKKLLSVVLSASLVLGSCVPAMASGVVEEMPVVVEGAADETANEEALGAGAEKAPVVGESPDEENLGDAAAVSGVAVNLDPAKVVWGNYTDVIATATVDGLLAVGQEVYFRVLNADDDEIQRDSVTNPGARTVDAYFTIYAIEEDREKDYKIQASLDSNFETGVQDVTISIIDKTDISTETLTRNGETVSNRDKVTYAQNLEMGVEVADVPLTATDDFYVGPINRLGNYTLTGYGKYKGNIPFTVVANEPESFDPFDIPDQQENGANPPTFPEITTISLADNTPLERDKDFTITTENHEAGDATAIIKGIGDYKGLIDYEQTFKIVSSAAPVVDSYEYIVDESKFVYDGDALKVAEVQAVTQVIKGGATSVNTGEYSVRVDSVTPGATGKAGEKYKITITINGADTTKIPTAKWEKEVTIAKKNLSSIEDLEAYFSESIEYNGKAQEPTNPDIKYDDADKGLVTIAKTEYTITGYRNNKNASDEAIVEIKAADNGNYTGTADAKFSIAPFCLDYADVRSQSVPIVEYNCGKQVTPSITPVAFFGHSTSDQIPASDYQLVYGDNNTAGDDAGSYYLKAASDNVYGNSDEVVFKINQLNLSKVTITQLREIEVGSGDLDDDDLKDTSAPVGSKNPYFSVTYNGIEVPVTDYTFTTIGNQTTINKEVTVTINALGDNTTGSKELKTKVKAKKLDATYESSADDIVYTGKALTPNAAELGALTTTVTGGKSAKLAATDYEIVPGTYTNNLNAGKATVQIRGKNEYDSNSTAVVTFDIQKYEVDGDIVKVEGIKAQTYGGENAELTGATVKIMSTDSEPKLLFTLAATDCTVTIKTAKDRKLTKVNVNYTENGNFKKSDGGSSVVDLDSEVLLDYADLNNATVTAKIPAGLSGYTANDIKKFIEVKVGGNEITGYDIKDISTGNISEAVKVVVGTPITFTIHGGNDANIVGNKTVSSTIVARNISDFEKEFILNSTPLTYTGEKQEPAFTNTAGLTVDVDYTVTYKNNIDATDKAIATVTGKGKYTGSFDKEFPIAKVIISDADVTINVPSAAERAYTGSFVDLASKITITAKADKKYVFSKDDYTVTINANQENKVKAGEVIGFTITAKADSKNYSAIELTGSYTVTRKDASKAVLTLDKESFEITGSDIYAKPQSVVLDGKTLKLGQDYGYRYDGTLDAVTTEDVIKAGKQPKVVVNFLGNYTGTASKTYTITGKELDLSKVRIVANSNLVYTGSKIENPVTTNLADSGLTAGQYTVEYTKDGKKVAEVKDAGEYTATIVGNATAGYSGTGKSVTFTVAPKTISNAEWNDITFKGLTAEYAGKNTKAPVIGSANVDVGSAQAWLQYSDFEVVEWDKEFPATGSTCKAKVAIADGKNVVYTGTKDVEFTMNKGVLSLDMFSFDDQEYTGHALEPAIKVAEGYEGVSASWATVKYFDQNVNVAQKTAKAYVELAIPESELANAKYANATPLIAGFITFNIVGADIAKATVAGMKDVTYNGKAQTPKVTVTYEDDTLRENKDYTVAYEDNTNAGTAKVIITGKGNYAGTVTKTFKINKASQTLKASAVTVTYGNKGTSLKVTGAKTKLTYKSSSTGIVTVDSKGAMKFKTAGKVTVTATAAASTNYNSKSIKVTVTVKPPKATGLSLKSSKSGQITVKASKKSAITGYQITYSQTKAFTKGKTKTVTVTSKSALTKTLKSLAKGKRYYVKVRTMKKTSAYTVYGDYCAAKSVTVKK